MIIRPKNFAYSIIYFLTALLTVGSLWLVYEYFFGREPLSIVALICCILAPLIFWIFSLHFAKVHIRVNDREIVITQFMWKTKKADDPRKITDFLFSQNGKIQRIVTDTVEPGEIKRYGLTKDLGMSFVERPPNPQMDLSQEIVFIMKNHEIKSFNARPYTKKSIRKLRDYINRTTGIEPTGSLKDL